MQFILNDMVCDGCARSVTKAIQRVDPGAAVTISVPEHRVDVQTDRPADQISAALTEAGFPPA